MLNCSFFFHFVFVFVFTLSILLYTNFWKSRLIQQGIALVNNLWTVMYICRWLSKNICLVWLANLSLNKSCFRVSQGCVVYVYHSACFSCPQIRCLISFSFSYLSFLFLFFIHIYTIKYFISAIDQWTWQVSEHMQCKNFLYHLLHIASQSFRVLDGTWARHVAFLDTSRVCILCNTQ